MKYSAINVPALPKNAWIFHHSYHGPKLFHGSGVHIHDNGFYEGCLVSKSTAGILDMPDVFATGMTIQKNLWSFVTPSHTLECLYLYRQTNQWSTSNSLALLTAYHKLIPPYSSHYGGIFASACLGIDDYQKALFRTNDGEVLRILFDNIDISSAGHYTLRRKPMPPPFCTFEEYTEYLSETLRSAFLSAGSGINPYRPLATCSTGYDSASIAALSAKLGCHEAVTLVNAKYGQSDSGRNIGELLGFKVFEYERSEKVCGSFESVADFLSTGMGGEDYCYHGFSPMLHGRILLTGFHGDKIWDVNVIPSQLIKRGDISGSSMQEYRLWNDFIHIPVPMIAARRHPDISAITRSLEMNPYKLNRRYDRPIPRRILEQAGVPRDLFGQHKKATSVPLYRNSHLLIDAAAREECNNAIPHNWICPIRHYLASFLWFAGYRLHRISTYMPGSSLLRQMLIGEYMIFVHSQPRASLEFIAALLIVARRYEKALANCAP